MTLIRRPTPLGELISLRNTVDRLFDDTLGKPRSGWLTATPSVAVDIHSTEPRQIQISPVSEAPTEVETEAQPATDPGTGQGS